MKKDNLNQLLTFFVFNSCSNAGLRTLFYRCCRLFTLGIRPVFVFDGDQRPAYKRNKVINTTICDTTEHHLFMAMLKLFRFAIWQAKGEAEAECAVLQRLGYVDLIFTTDVDVFLFGGQRVVRTWPGVDYELISCVDIDWIQQMVALDRSDMIFMALLSGSDYGSGINRIGTHISHALARLKLHRPLLDAIQTTLERSDSNSNDDTSTRDLLGNLMDDLQHELNTNQSGYLRRRQHNMDLATLVDPELFSRLAEDWIHPKTAILDPTNTEAAKTMHHLLNDQDIIPDFVALASFCQIQFDWSKAITIGKFARKVYPGYMLHRIITQARRPTTASSTGKTSQSDNHRKRHHPYFDTHYRKKDLFYKDDTLYRPDDLQRIQKMEDVRKNKKDIRLQKLSRCRVEWQQHTLETFLTMVKRELLDDVGTDTDCNTQTPSQKSDIDSEVGSQPPQQHASSQSSQYDSDDGCIDITAGCVSRAPSPRYAIDLSPTSASPPPPPPPPKEAESNWMYEFCDPKQCCRQWIGAKLVQNVYPSLMKAYTSGERTKKNRRTTKDDTQKKLDTFFTRTNGIDTKEQRTTDIKHHSPSVTAAQQQCQQLRFGQHLVLPRRKK